jgi:hypothetical protein
MQQLGVDYCHLRMTSPQVHTYNCTCGASMSFLHQAPWRGRILPMWRVLLAKHNEVGSHGRQAHCNGVKPAWCLSPPVFTSKSTNAEL